MSDNQNQAPATKSELYVKFNVVAAAYARPVQRVDNSKRASSTSHMLTWHRDPNKADSPLVEAAIVDQLIEYIIELEQQLQIEAGSFRADTLASIIKKTSLDGFDGPDL